MYSKKQIELFEKAGKISVQVKIYAREIVKPGMKMLDVAEQIEEKIRKLGGKPAFPVNVCVNEKAAHFTPPHNEDSVLGKDLVKIDLGVAVDSCLVDTAITLDLTSDKRYEDMIKATKLAFENASKLCTPGRPVCEIGKRVHEIITQAGFSPVRNLSGHEIKPGMVHAGLTIPNYDNGNKTRLKKGIIIAIEPFATTGEGVVQDGKLSETYSFVGKKPVRDSFARKVLAFIECEYDTLPFTSRWIFKKFGNRVSVALRLLTQAGCLHRYKELIEKSRAPVAQHENTILVGENPKVLTELT